MDANNRPRRRPPMDISGVLLVDKPATWTSFDVVNFVRSRFNIGKVGHCGTLDPAATGLLVLVLGKCTALSGVLSGDDKTYSATVRLGVETDSYDLDGEVVARKDASMITSGQLESCLAGFVGPGRQVPPMVSAIKKNGRRLCDLARKGVTVEREPRDIVISSIVVDAMRLPECDFTMTCSKGTYVRSLCHDIGVKLGCGAVLTALRRVRSGRFDVSGATTIDELKTLDQAGLAARVLPAEA
ncbi:MAG: tRNA pseudouridine(55) synthase TruB [Victivallaceae bacterium]|nr:tRNA pseudouridine(55) synthase TruB [Victivallaceae bacterium]